MIFDPYSTSARTRNRSGFGQLIGYKTRYKTRSGFGQLIGYKTRSGFGKLIGYKRGFQELEDKLSNL